MCPVGLAVIDAPRGVRARKLSERQYRDRQQIAVGSWKDRRAHLRAQRRGVGGGANACELEERRCVWRGPNQLHACMAASFLDAPARRPWLRGHRARRIANVMSQTPKAPRMRPTAQIGQAPPKSSRSPPPARGGELNRPDSTAGLETTEQRPGNNRRAPITPRPTAPRQPDCSRSGR